MMTLALAMTLQTYEPLHCRVVSPAARIADFVITSSEDAVRFVPEKEAAWPKVNTLAKLLEPKDEVEGALWEIGAEKNSLLFSFDHESGEMWVELDRKVRLPVAVGFCRDVAFPTVAVSIDSEEGNPFDPRAWQRSDCPIIGRDGNLGLIDVTLHPSGGAVIEGDFMSSQRDGVRVTFPTKIDGKLRNFGSRGSAKLSGTTRSQLAGQFFVRELWFDDLDNSDATTRYAAICGTGVAVRTPNTERPDR